MNENFTQETAVVEIRVKIPYCPSELVMGTNHRVRLGPNVTSEGVLMINMSRICLSVALVIPAVSLANFSSQIQNLRWALQNAGMNTSLADQGRQVSFGPSQFQFPVDRAPWAGNYFGNYHGGMATRWQDKTYQSLAEDFEVNDRLRMIGFRLPDQRGDIFQLLSQTEIKAYQSNIRRGFMAPQLNGAEVRARLQAMSPEQIDLLSPAEKYDILRGDYSFQFTKSELLGRGPYARSAHDSSAWWVKKADREKPVVDYTWEGFCNGVRAAGILFPEPVRVVEGVNPDGIVVRFQPADLKALAGLAYFGVERVVNLGGRNGGKILGIARIQGSEINAAVFDIAIRTYLATGQKGFVIDADYGVQVWNETVVGYKRQVFGTGDRRKVHLAVYLLGETDILDSNGKTTDRVASLDEEIGIVTKNYNYELKLDRNGRIVGGEWTSKEQPDFAWFPTGDGADGNPYHNFQDIKSLVERSAQ